MRNKYIVYNGLTLVEKLEGNNYLGYLGVGGRIILKWMLK
jgi:hypothetical protein